MYVAIGIFWALGIGLLAQSAYVLFGTSDFLRYMRLCLARPLNDFTPPVALLIACKGLDADFESNVSSYLSQDYPPYQVIFTVASVDDPAYQALRTRLKKGARNEQRNQGVHTALVVAGYSELRGEKVHNLLEGLKAVDAKAEVLAFADTDACPRRDWLRSLVAPLQDPTVIVSTGAALNLPGSSFVSQLRAAWAASSLTLMGDHEYNFAWAASMAVRTSDFKRLEVAERHWANTVSDDNTLSYAVREAGGRIRFEPRCVLACQGEAKLGEFLRWCKRQITIRRVYWPGNWWIDAIGYVFYGGTVLLGLVMLALPSISTGQRLLTAGILLMTLLLGLSRGLIHMIIAKELFPEEASSLSRYGARYWQLSLLVPWLVLINILVSSVTRRIEWRGTHYELTGRNETRVLRRKK